MYFFCANPLLKSCHASDESRRNTFWTFFGRLSDHVVVRERVKNSIKNWLFWSYRLVRDRISIHQYIISFKFGGRATEWSAWFSCSAINDTLYFSTSQSCWCSHNYGWRSLPDFQWNFFCHSDRSSPRATGFHQKFMTLSLPPFASLLPLYYHSCYFCISERWSAKNILLSRSFIGDWCVLWSNTNMTALQFHITLLLVILGQIQTNFADDRNCLKKSLSNPWDSF
jgi:hypothetical protein